ncbi:MAG: hypothetical protein CMJ83_19515 [Planctomycetes bacterium]|nr:hypothetical protein [Planctomycetota bacterium]
MQILTARPEEHGDIREMVDTFYEENFAGSVLKREESLAEAVDEIQRIYELNVFPEMNVDWTTYADHIGHRNSPGCFRCHDGEHVDERGEVLNSDCALCHLFVEKARDSESLIEVPADLTNLHPFRNEAHDEVDCWTCHTGDSSPYADCKSCHEEQASPHGMEFGPCATG